MFCSCLALRILKKKFCLLEFPGDLYKRVHHIKYTINRQILLGYMALKYIYYYYTYSSYLVVLISQISFVTFWFTKRVFGITLRSKRSCNSLVAAAIRRIRCFHFVTPNSHKTRPQELSGQQYRLSFFDGNQVTFF